MSKDYTFWTAGFRQGLPYHVADWWCQKNGKALNSAMEELGAESLLRHSGGQTNHEAVARWLIEESGILEDVDSLLPRFGEASELVTDLRDNLGLDRDLKTGRVLAPRLKEAFMKVLPAFFPESTWWKENVAELRREGQRLMKVGKVMES